MVAHPLIYQLGIKTCLKANREPWINWTLRSAPIRSRLRLRRVFYTPGMAEMVLLK